MSWDNINETLKVLRKYQAEEISISYQPTFTVIVPDAIVRRLFNWCWINPKWSTSHKRRHKHNYRDLRRKLAGLKKPEAA